VPELPEVETTRRGIEPHLIKGRIQHVRVRNRQLRWPVPEGLEEELRGQVIERVERRAKYLLLGTARGTAILHLGMSGSLRVLAEAIEPGKHDHVDIVLEDGKTLRYRDPRRFGCLLWTNEEPDKHPLLRKLGPEPLSKSFHGGVLYEKSRGRRVAVKQFIMDHHTVVGVGNIYASEALHHSRIHPHRACGRVGKERYQKLSDCIKTTLAKAIDAGGTTLKDFSKSDGQPGYFKQELHVYGRDGEGCLQCSATIARSVLGQRATYFCPECQR
tara:strand:+ start:768 stop:1583 length:816 start_codon:yes stop_codon:yes gene_type:complete